MHCKKLLPIVLIAVILFSCNAKKEMAAADMSLVEKIEMQPEPGSIKNKEPQIPIPTGNNTQTTDTVTSQIPSSKTTSVDWDKKIIKTANLKFEVKDFKTYSANIYKTVKQFGGYIASENQNTTDYKIETSLSIKVPVDQFESMMALFPGADAKIIERSISTDDVSGEIVDVKARLAAKKQMREKYMEFFKQAKNMEEVLQVQQEINGLQEVMESAAGRISYLTHQSAMSTINLTFYQPLEGFNPASESPSFLTRATNAFKTGAVWCGDFFIGLLTLWPLLLAAVLLYFGFKKISRTKIKQPNA